MLGGSCLMFKGCGFMFDGSGFKPFKHVVIV